MKNDVQYGDGLCSVYDELNDGVDICSLADYIISGAERFSKVAFSRVLDLACGTGNMAIELARRGYDVTASDISESMLSVADNKARSAGQNVRFICQDMRRTKTYSSVDLTVCLSDSINYLLTTRDLFDTFESVYASTVSGGMFVFDMNTNFKFENIYADNAYVLESERALCAWQNYYNKKNRICDFYLSIFTEKDGGLYERTDEHQRERCYSVKTMKKLLTKAGFSVCGAFAKMSFDEAFEDRDERIFIFAKKEV